MRNAALSLLGLFLSTFCLAAGHDVTPPLLGPSPFPVLPTVATNGDTFLAVWKGAPWFYGAFFDRNGKRISSQDIPFLQPQPYPLNFGVTTLGNEYILIWSDYSGVSMTRLGADGVAPQPVRTALPPIDIASVASNGNAILVVGSLQGSFPTPPPHPRAFLIDDNGSLVGGPFEISGWGLPHASPAANSFVVTSTFPDRVVVQTLPDGTEFDVPGSGVNAAVAASSGSEIVVVWTEAGTFWSAAIDSSGTVTKQQIATPASLSASGYDARIAWDGDAYVASAGQYIVRLDRGGRPLQNPIDAGRTLVDSATGGAVTFAVGFAGDSVVLPKNATAVRSDSVSLTPSDQSQPSVASDGLNFMAAFAERDASTKRVTAALLSRAGDPLKQASIPETLYSTQPAIAFGAGIYAMTWADSDGLYASRFTTSGTPIDAQPILVRKTPWLTASIEWSGKFFLISFVENGVDVARLGADGTVSDAVKVDPGLPADRLPPHVSFSAGEARLACSRESCLAVWGFFLPSMLEGPPIRWGTAVARLSLDGVPLDTQATIIDIGTPQTPADFVHASVASNGREFLLALDGLGGITTVPVGASGTVGARQKFFSWFGQPQSDIAFDGSDYVIGWRYGALSTWVAIARARADGTRSASVVVDGGMTDLSPVAIASDSLHEAMLALGEFANGSPVRRARAYFDWEMKPMPAPPPAPQSVAATGSGSNVVVTWKSPQGADGVLIDVMSTNGMFYSGGLAPATKQMFSTTTAWFTVAAVRVRAFNAAGISDPVIVYTQPQPRRRVTHHS